MTQRFYHRLLPFRAQCYNAATMKVKHLLPLFLLLWLAACKPKAVEDATPSPEPPVETPVPTATSTPKADHPIQLRLWLPLRFADPSLPAANLLTDRLEAFELDNPGIDIQIRIKQETGQAGLLASLFTASEAAPDALPDLVILDAISLNSAALKGLTVPLEGIIAPPQEPSWYEHAVQAAHVDGIFCALPFATQADVLAYSTNLYNESPTEWTQILESGGSLLIPAADPNASFTLSLYQGLGGVFWNDDGTPILDAKPLEKILEFYAGELATGLLPQSSMNLTTSEETWNAFQSIVLGNALVPLDQTLAHPNSGLSVIPWPLENGQSVVPNTTWSWSIITADPDRQALTAALLEWLAEPSFLGSWTNALHMIPPTPTALAEWPVDGDSANVNRMLPHLASAPGPSEKIELGPMLAAAVAQVINEGVDASQAAQQAVDSLPIP